MHSMRPHRAGYADRHVLAPRLGLAAGLLLCLTAACDDEEPAGPTTESFTATNVAIDQSVDPAGRCAPEQTLDIAGAGPSNLGAITVEQSHCFDPNGPNPLAFHDGEFTITLADGDSFSGSYDGTTTPTADPVVFTIDGEWDVTGGAGDFAGATGSGTATGQANVQTGEGSITLEGTIRH